MTIRPAHAMHLLLASVLAALAVPTQATAQTSWRIKVGPEVSIDIGKLRNAPNGHISYQQGPKGLTLWVDGRVRNPQTAADSTQGTFMLSPASWDSAALVDAKPLVKVFEGVHDSTLPCTASSAWYRNYAAINAVIPGPGGVLLAFVDGEFHPLNTGTPLRASIGVATSTDNGRTWKQRSVIIQGKDIVAARFDCQAVDKQMRKPIDNVGAAGPSAVVRTDGTTKYIYVYFLDRVRFSSKTNPTSDIYVARSPYSSGGAPHTWQFWTGRGWSAPDSELMAQPVIRAPVKGGEAAHPEVTYNSVLKRWLMVFHTRTDLYASSSADGTSWDAPQPVGAAVGQARAPAFPTLVTPGPGDQQTTGASGWLFYSREETVTSPTPSRKDSTGGRKEYFGFRRSYTISTAGARKPPCATPRDCCSANGGTWSGGRCH